MHKPLLVAWRDYKATVCTKAFVLGLIVAPVFMCGGGIVTALMKSNIDTRDRKVAVVDRSGALAEALVGAAARRNEREVYDKTTDEKIAPGYLLEIVPPDEANLDAQKLELSNRVRRGELHAFLLIGRSVIHPRQNPQEGKVAYYAANPVMDKVRDWITHPVNDTLRKQRLADAKVAESSVEDLFDWIPAEGFSLISEDAESGEIRDAKRTDEIQAILLPIIPVMLMFLLVMMGAMPHLQAISEEKSQRIAEVLLGSIRPFELMLGKLLGGVAVSMTGAVIYVAGTILVVSYLGHGEFIPYAVLPWFFAFLICANLLYGSLFAALGSACNDATEAQSVTLPAMLPILVPVFTIMPVLGAPNGSLALWLSFFPPFTPFHMLLRMGTPVGVPAWQPWLGLVLVLTTTVFFVWVGGRVFRVGILIHGAPPRLKSLLHWALRG